MLVLKIIGITLLLVSLLAALSLALPVDIILKVDNKNGFSVMVRFLQKVFGKQKTTKKNSPVAEKIKKALGLSPIESPKAFTNTLKDQGIAGTLSETLDTMITIVDRIFWLLKRCRISQCNIKYVTAGEDAAIEYGKACAIIYPLVGYLQSQRKLKPRNLRLNIQCDYTADNSVYDINIAVRVSILYIVKVLWHIASKNAAVSIDKSFKDKQKGSA